MVLTRISFQAIPVDNQDRALAFYRDVLGLEVQTDAPYEEGWRWIFLRIPGSDSRITFARRGEISYGDKPVLALVSDDVDADCAAWAALRVRIASPPADAPWMQGVRWATIRDSEGNLIFVESWKG
jgi:catechol 2,3-dioxygenase-like lactoylglutathione lyase family enzyme